MRRYAAGAGRSGGAVRVLAGLALVVLWSSGFVGAQLGARQASAITLLAWRYLITSAILLVGCLIVRPCFTRAEVVRQIVLGLVCQLGYLVPVYLGVQYGVHAGTVSLIAAIQPLFVAVLAGPLLGERGNALQRIGLLVGFAGVLVVVSGDIRLGQAPWWAYLLPVAGVLSLGSGTLLGRRWRASSFLMSLTVQTGTAAVGMLVIATLTGQLAPPVTPGFAVAAGWVAILSGLGGYGAYLLVLRSQGATAASSWLYLSPPVTMLWTWLMFGDRIAPLGILGLFITAAGVLLSTGDLRNLRGRISRSGR
ncbi:DMT family transporter [Microlunatus soli]|uniref:DMT family transporter n=1 Tax=Microlunatus soli TaxID=630515 RepID=UPI000B86E410|nr:DMT family transporter [Microlunatus soli]